MENLVFLGTDNCYRQISEHHQLEAIVYILSMLSINVVILLFLPRLVNMMFCCQLSDGERHKLFAE